MDIPEDTKRVQSLLRSQHGFCHSLLAAREMAGLGHWHLNLKTQELFWSDEVFRIYGYQPKAFTPHVEQAIAAYQPVDRSRITKAVERGIAKGSAWHEEFRLVRADGAIRNVLATGKPRYEQGELVALFGVFQDITEQRSHQQYITQLSQVVELTQEGIIIADPEGRVTWVNKGFEQISGYTLAEIIGKKPGDVLQGRDTDPDTQAYMATMIAKQEPFTAEILNYRKNGTPYWLKVNIYPQFAANSELLAFMAVQTDITEAKLVQERLEQQTLALNEEIRRREVLERELRMLAFNDSLTGIFNRCYFFNQFDSELSRVKRYGGALSLILLDIDHFKNVNDSYGHDVGDLVLVEVAKHLNDTIRHSDLLARIGGEEFAVLAQETELDIAVELAERLRLAVRQPMYLRQPEHKISVTISLGVTQLTMPDDDAQQAYKRADQALYRAKNSGRNRVVSTLC